MQIAPRWTAAQDAILTAGLLEHKTHTQLAAVLGKTKNSCCARAMRLRDKAGGISRPKHAAPSQKQPRRNGHIDGALLMKLRRAKEREPRLPSEPMAPMTARFQEGFLGQIGRLALIELTTGVCRYPIDQPSGPVRYCGDTVAGHSVYCPHHAERVVRQQ